MSETRISCPNCAQHIAIDDAWSGQTVTCPSCQQPFTVPQLIPTAAAAPAAPPPAGGLRLSAASAPPPPLTAPAPARPGAAPRTAAAQPARTSGLAITSLILSLLGCFGITAIAGVICGHLARKRIRQDPSLTGSGLALAGIIIGYAMIVFSVLSLVFFAFLSSRVGDEIEKVKRETRMRPTHETTTASDFEPAPAEPGMGTFGGSDAEEKALPAPQGAVSGTIKGQPFTYSRAKLDSRAGLLDIEEGTGFIPDQGVKIFLFPKAGESLANRTWKVAASASGMNPHVHLRWQENGTTRLGSFMQNYTMELKTGEITNGVVTGSITLKAAGNTPVDLKGNFTAKVE